MHKMKSVAEFKPQGNFGGEIDLFTGKLSVCVDEIRNLRHRRKAED